MPNKECPFCSPRPELVWWQDAVGLVLKDKYPISNGHSLVVPIRHAACLFDLPADDQAALWALVANVRELLSKQLNPDGFNVGINDGAAAGQTVAHAHIHVIPRWIGDVHDARGGIRWVLPEKAKYWNDQ